MSSFDIPQPPPADPADANASKAHPPADSKHFVPSIVAIVVLVIGSIGPWATFSNGIPSNNGLDVDGVITLAVAVIVALVLGIAKMRDRNPSRVVLVIAAIIALAVTIYDVLDVSGTKILTIEASPGWGLYVALLGGLILAIAAVLRIRSD